MKGLKQMDTGGLSFQDIRSEDKFYVDKSMLISDLLGTNDRGVYLFTRPRRFGKSTNISMLDAFFNLKYEGNSWFDGLEISEHPEYERYMNAYPVIYLDLSTVSSDSYEQFLGAMRTVVVREFDRHAEILENGFMSPSERHLYDVLSDDTAPENKVWNAPLILSSMLERHHGRKVVVLIDEYDRAITNAFGTAIMGKLVGFMGNMMSSLLKGNRSLQMAYVTGVMQVAKSGMFSGANNLMVNNVLSPDSDERFGFTESEVEGILGYYGHPDRMDEVREWYDGYRFGDADVYNPFSVMSYVSNGFRPLSYWVNSGNDRPIRWMLERGSSRNMDTVADIISGQPAMVDIHPDMTYEDMRMARDSDLYSLMTMSGYLKAVKTEAGSYSLSVPNREVMGMVEKVLKDVVPVDDSLFRDFAIAVMDGDGELMESILSDLLEGTSYFDLKDESDYKLAVFLCLHGIISRYDVACERQKGNDRLDIIMISDDLSLRPIVMEIKMAGSEDALERGASDAIRQIHDRRYYNGLKGDVLLYGIAFHGVVPKVKSETVHL